MIIHCVIRDHDTREVRDAFDGPLFRFMVGMVWFHFWYYLRQPYAVAWTFGLGRIRSGQYA